MAQNSHNQGNRVDTGFRATGAANKTNVCSVIWNNQTSTPSTGTFVERRLLKAGSAGGGTSAKGWRYPTPYILCAVRRIGYQVDIVNEKRKKYPPLIADHVEGISIPRPTSSYGYSPDDSEFFSVGGQPNVSLNLVKDAETRALAKFQSAQMNIGASIAEAHETVESMASTATLLAHIAIDAYNKKWDRLASRFNQAVGPTHGVNTMASAWLAYQFGIQPLVNDVQGAMKAWNDQVQKKDMLLHCTALSKDKSLPIPWLLTPSFWQWANWSGQCERSAKVILWATIDDARLATYGKYGLNPISMLWEALGFSWLIDYVLSIGNFLSALGSTIGLKFRSGTLSTRVYANLDYNGMPSDPLSTVHWIGGGWKTKYRCLALHRTVYGDWPIPWVTAKNPFTSGAHVANLLALLASFKFKKAQSMGPMTLVGNYPNVNTQRR